MPSTTRTRYICTAILKNLSPLFPIVTPQVCDSARSGLRFDDLRRVQTFSLSLSGSLSLFLGGSFYPSPGQRWRQRPRRDPKTIVWARVTAIRELLVLMRLCLCGIGNGQGCILSGRSHLGIYGVSPKGDHQVTQQSKFFNSLPPDPESLCVCIYLSFSLSASSKPVARESQIVRQIYRPGEKSKIQAPLPARPR